ncbi:hypothetical protein D3C80_2099640 [compost metagenome]
MWLGGSEHVGRLGGTGGRKLDVEVAVMPARGNAGAAERGVGLAGSQDFFDLAHGVNPQKCVMCICNRVRINRIRCN